MNLDVFCFIIAMIFGSLLCILDINARRLIVKENKELRSENDYLREELNYWKNRTYKKDDVINEIYQFIKKHYEE